MAEPISMVASQIYIVKHFVINLEDNSISKTGCSWLTKANWMKLEDINLSNIQITQVKMIFIGKAANISVIVLV
jgi:hypothetical protein